MHHRGTLIAGHTLIIFYLVLAYGTSVLSSVLAAAGLSVPAAGAVIAVMTYVCVVASVWWMFMGEDDVQMHALVKRTGSITCSSQVIVALSMAAYGLWGFVVDAGPHALVYAICALAGIVGFMSCSHAALLLRREASRVQADVRPARTGFDTLSLVASAAYMIASVVVVALCPTGAEVLSALGALVLNLASVVAGVWLTLRCDVELMTRKGGECHG